MGAFVPKGGKVGGGQQYACQSLIDATENDPDIHWITLDTTATTNQERSFLQRFLPALRRIALFLWYLSTKKIDAVLLFTANGFSFMEKGLMAIFASFLGKKVSLSPRTEMVALEAEASAWRKKFTKYVFKRCTNIICQGLPIQENFLKILDEKDKYTIIPNWIDTEMYVKNRPSYTTTNSKPVQILFLGWIDQYWKGVFDLIEAVAQIKHLDFVLHLGGDGVDLEASKKMVALLGIEEKIVFEGWVNHQAKMSLLQKTDIFVLPSHSEGYPNALIEAMASGIPAIASQVGCVADIIRQGENGFMMPSHDVATLAKHLSTLISDPELRIQLADQARLDVLNRNNLNKILPRLRAIL